MSDEEPTIIIPVEDDVPVNPELEHDEQDIDDFEEDVDE
jgi:hypothetical protein